MSDPSEIKVAIAGRAYSIWVGEGLLERAAELIPISDGAEMIGIVADAGAAALHGERLAGGLRATGLRIEQFTLPPGEESKTLSTVESVLRWLAGNGAHRADVVVALGGGVACDVAGLVAALFSRGIAVAHVPTTVLAQVDAAIGGKTGVNLPEGKNLAGAFHQPVAVLADLVTLTTLPARDFAAGFAEVAKHGLIADREILALLQRDREKIAGHDGGTLKRIITRAVAVKARVVQEDETERGIRAFLNYGHTLAHALEAHTAYGSWRHGEAVAIGMMFAAHLAPLAGFASRIDEHRAPLEALGLPVHGAGAPYEDIASLWQRDKKYRRGMRFVLLEDVGAPRVVSHIDEDALREAYEAVR